MKKCTKCGADKPLDQFALRRGRTSGVQSSCRQCQSEYHRKRYAENEQYRNNRKQQAKARKEVLGHSYLQYGITKDQLDDLARRFDGMCYSCRNRPWTCVDHDHQCCPGDKKTCGNCVRGLLCHQCNIALGLLSDNPDEIEKLLVYIKNTQTVPKANG